MYVCAMYFSTSAEKFLRKILSEFFLRPPVSEIWALRQALSLSTSAENWHQYYKIINEVM